MSKIKLFFDNIVIEINSKKEIVNNLAFIYRNYIYNGSIQKKNTDIYFKIKLKDNYDHDLITNDNVKNIYYSYNNNTYEKWKYEDTIFPPVLIPPLSGKYMILHGSALEVNGDAYLILGPTMSGKTTMMLYLIEKNFKILSDDLILIDDLLNVHPYKKPFGFRTTISKTFPELMQKISKLEAKLVFTSFEGITTYLVHPEDLFENPYSEVCSKIKKIIILPYEGRKLSNINSYNIINSIKKMSCNSGLNEEDKMSRIFSLTKNSDIIMPDTNNPEIIYENYLKTNN